MVNLFFLEIQGENFNIVNILSTIEVGLLLTATI
jgi:hypothetical protein